MFRDNVRHKLMEGPANRIGILLEEIMDKVSVYRKLTEDLISRLEPAQGEITDRDNARQKQVEGLISQKELLLEERTDKVSVLK